MTDKTRLLGPEPLVLARVEAFSNDAAFAAAFAAHIGAPPPVAGRWSEGANARLYFAEEKARYIEAEAGPLALKFAGLAGVSDISGAFRRLRLEGPATLEVLSLETYFPTADRGLKPGDLVATLLRHAPVLMVVHDPEHVDLLVPPSYVADMAEGLERAISRL